MILSGPVLGLVKSYEQAVPWPAEGSAATGAGSNGGPGPSSAGLAEEIDRVFVDGHLSWVCRTGPAQSLLPRRLVVGLILLKHMHDPSDEVLCTCWLENHHFRNSCGEESFRKRLSFERSSLTSWRQRMGEEQLAALLHESLSVAHNAGAVANNDIERVVVDTTMQPKSVALPTDARLMHKVIVVLGHLAKKHGVPLPTHAMHIKTISEFESMINVSSK